LPESSVHIINETNAIYESDSFFEKSNVTDGFIRYNSAKSIKSLKSLKSTNTLSSLNDSEMGDNIDDPDTIIIKRPNQSAYRKNTKPKQVTKTETKNKDEDESTEQK
jgi:hypothetical protein